MTTLAPTVRDRVLAGVRGTGEPLSVAAREVVRRGRTTWTYAEDEKAYAEDEDVRRRR
ncbi:hypothetical protein JIX56_18335 [Streptomyces sp. CA-210063]|uniref:hypothetical protein n=1 Tax=Streptomyces sp. CA-210063 TaxID=2801029 RepID=UPI00214B8868|nr:hypothetical protein [Streptomyces sp. CA-210063]UUU31710.1 hypothetical protein JIX56_18335 [Streptomyces sp. CA-210063]